MTKTWKLGESASTSTVMSDWKNSVFADLSGDYNPVHFDTERMKKTRFKEPIGNGIFTLSLIGSAIVKLFTTDNTMPIAVEQHNSFIAPVFVGDKITAIVEVVDNPHGTPLKRNEYWVACKVLNQDDNCVLSAMFRIRVLHA